MCAIGLAGLFAGGAVAAPSASLPESWLQRWANPPLEDRPLQIVHGIPPKGLPVPGMAQGVPGAPPEARIQQGMERYKELGLGGVVCNVTFENYLQSEESWKALAAGVDACRKLGMDVWIYDEKGYPSGSAGGLVLKEHPEYEAQELAYDPALPDPFVLRPAYEFTHASNNYHAARRYINLIDDRAVRAFIAKTHQAYRERLGDRMGSTVRAFFTDEPSLIAVNLGQIPESARKSVPVDDPLDRNVKALPAVPWGYDLAERYRERYGEDLLPARRSLFTGDTEADRKVRRQYWALIADLVSGRYFGAIQRWCAAAGVASSGHTLWEEMVMHHPALEGNGLKCLSRMDIPGEDMLNSDPQGVFHGGWMAAALPASAAVLSGGRRVFTEVSDFSQKMTGQGPAPLAEMQATAAYQAAWGVTDFTLYYSAGDRSAEEYNAYCAYVGRLNALLKPASLDPQVLLYYPVYDLWAEYRPAAEPISGQNQTPRAQRLAGSFMRLGQAFARSQVPFSLVDHEFLAGATVRKSAQGEVALSIRGHLFRALALPEDAELPPAAAQVVERFRQAGGHVLQDTPAARLTGAAVAEASGAPYRLQPESDQVVLGRFVRDGRPLLLLVNVGTAPYEGQLAVAKTGAWTRLDPASGKSEPAPADGTGRVALSLPARGAVVLVGGR